jgi:hypothetical protein
VIVGTYARIIASDSRKDRGTEVMLKSSKKITRETEFYDVTADKNRLWLGDWWQNQKT